MPAASVEERELHAQVILKDDLAFARLCDMYYEPVFKKLLAFNRGIAAEDETLIMDVVTDSFMNYHKNPHKFDPEKQGLEGFLLMDASGDLKNAWEKLKRLQKKIQKSVELTDKNGNDMMEDPDLIPIHHIIREESADLLNQKLMALFSSEKDIQIAHLLLSGERRRTEYARVLEIENLEIETQNLEIKRCKDRIDKTIKRKFTIKND